MIKDKVEAYYISDYSRKCDLCGSPARKRIKLNLENDETVEIKLCSVCLEELRKYVN